MATWETRILASADSQPGDNAKVRIPLNTDAPLGALKVTMRGTGGASGVANIETVFNTIRVVADGNNEVFKMNAESLLYQTMLDNNILEANVVTEADGANTEITWIISFGRPGFGMKDSLYNLPATKYKTLTLEIECGTIVAATAWAASSPLCYVEGTYYVGGAIRPFFKHIEEESHTSAAQTKYVELGAAGRLVRASLFASATVAADLTNASLELNNGGKILTPNSADEDIRIENAIDYGYNGTIPADWMVLDVARGGTDEGAYIMKGTDKARVKLTEGAGSTIRVFSTSIVN